LAQKRSYVVVWFNKRSKETLAYPSYAASNDEALRNAAGAFKKILYDDESVFAATLNEATVYPEGSAEYEKYLGLAYKFKSLYLKERDRSRILKTLKKISKRQNPLPAFSSRRCRRKIHPGQATLF